MNPLDFFFQFAAAFVAAIIALTLGRAIAARIAGPHADALLNTPIIPISLSLNIALPHRREVEEDHGNDMETGNTETAGNTGETQGNSAVSLPQTSQTFEANDLGTHKTLPVMSREELSELRACHNDALTLLARCMDYYKAQNETDFGIIPRYDKIRMKAEYRGQIVDMLEYSGVVSKTKNKTFVVPEIGTCTALFNLIHTDKRRIYPVGYAERKQAVLDSAVNALPGYERE